MAINKKTGRRLPKPTRGKTVKDTQLVRFVDLNQYVDEIEGEFIPLPESPNNGDALVYNSTTEEWEAFNDGQPAIQTATVEVSSAEILALHTTPIELLPALNAGQTYKVSELIATYIFNTTPYVSDFGDALLIEAGTQTFEWLTDGFVRSNSINRQTAFIYREGAPSSLDLSKLTPVTLALDEGFPLTGGDGTIKIKITYQVIDVSY